MQKWNAINVEVNRNFSSLVLQFIRNGITPVSLPAQNGLTGTNVLQKLLFKCL